MFVDRPITRLFNTFVIMIVKTFLIVICMSVILSAIISHQTGETFYNTLFTSENASQILMSEMKSGDTVFGMLEEIPFAGMAISLVLGFIKGYFDFDSIVAYDAFKEIFGFLVLILPLNLYKKVAKLCVTQSWNRKSSSFFFINIIWDICMLIPLLGMVIAGGNLFVNLVTNWLFSIVGTSSQARGIALAVASLAVISILLLLNLIDSWIQKEKFGASVIDTVLDIMASLIIICLAYTLATYQTLEISTSDGYILIGITIVLIACCVGFTFLRSRYPKK